MIIDIKKAKQRKDCSAITNKSVEALQEEITWACFYKILKEMKLENLLKLKETIDGLKK